MRTIDRIFIHCTAGYGDVAAIRRWWRSLGWKMDGYHYFIYEDGTVVKLQPLSVVTNGVRNFNGRSVHIAYQGGVDRMNVTRPVDTRTVEQKAAILTVIREVLEELKATQNIRPIQILGHRDISPDTNGNGIVDSHERIKECPSFDAIPEYNWITLQSV